MKRLNQSDFLHNSLKNSFKIPNSHQIHRTESQIYKNEVISIYNNLEGSDDINNYIDFSEKNTISTETKSQNQVDEISQEEIEFKEKAKKIDELRKNGNFLFYDSKINESILIYKEAISLIEIDERISLYISNNYLNTNKVDCLYGIANSYYKLKEFQFCVDFTTKVFDVQKNHYKSRLLRAKAYKKLNQLKLAYQDAKYAFSIKSTKALFDEIKEIECILGICGEKEMAETSHKSKSSSKLVSINLLEKNENRPNFILTFLKMAIFRIFKKIKSNKILLLVILFILSCLFKKTLNFNWKELLRVYSFNIL